MRCTGICRGRGVAYLAVEFDLRDQASEVRFFSHSEECVELPIEAYHMATGSQDACRYVAVVPLLDTKRVSVEMRQYDKEGSELCRARKVFSRFAIKWASRFNYKFSYDRAMAMRDIDRSTYSKQIHLTPQVFVEAPTKRQYVIKGYACLPAGDFAEFRLLDGMGRAIETFDLSLGKVEESTALGMPRREVSFTLRIPADGSTYCLLATSTRGNKSGFLCLDAAARGDYAVSRSPLLYRSAGLNEYGARALARKKLLSSIDANAYADCAGPKFSIVVPLFRTPLPFLRDMVGSVQGQLYRNWELLLLNASPEDEGLAAALDELDDDRIKVIELVDNAGIAANTNVGIEQAGGDYIVFFDHDDTLDPFALLKYVQKIEQDPTLDALYCDEDFLNEEGEYVSPHFKSDFNIDLLRCHNYITHLLAVRASYAKELMLRSEFDGAQDYDFLLRLVERTTNIAHVPDVLYHWRISDTSTAKSAGNKGYADEAGRKALQEHLDRCGLAATAEGTENACFYHVAYEVADEPLVSILIPNKDSVKVLSRCIESVEQKTTYRNFEIIVIENNSVQDETFAYYREVQERYDNVRVVTWDGPFNYSAINNFGAKHASGEYLLLLNNDVEVIEAGWMSAMLGLCQREDVGVVGAKLLFPDDTVQHAGVMMIKCASANDNAGPMHVFSHLDRDDPGYMRRAQLVQDLSVVTAACLMTKRSVFDALGGLNEDFVVAFNDVDYCLRVREMGKLVVFTPDALLYHYESFSRGADTLDANVERFIREQGKMRSTWSRYYVQGDPYHGPASTVAYYTEMP